MSDIHKSPAPQQSERFSASDADVIFKSVDSVLFNIHRKNLEANTGAFPSSEISTEGQIVALSESSDTLELMFQYVYPILQPDVPSLPFTTLAPLAEAVEKYQVYPAMLICKIHMQKFLPENALRIMIYAAKHGYKDIADEAAPLLLLNPLEIILLRLPASLILPWTLYYSAWERVRRSALSFATKSELATLRRGDGHLNLYPVYKRGSELRRVECHCNVDKSVCDVLVALNNRKIWRSTARVFASSSSCQRVASCLNTWRDKTEREIKSIKPFSTYL